MDLAIGCHRHVSFVGCHARRTTSRISFARSIDRRGIADSFIPLHSHTRTGEAQQGGRHRVAAQVSVPTHWPRSVRKVPEPAGLQRSQASTYVAARTHARDGDRQPTKQSRNHNHYANYVCVYVSRTVGLSNSMTIRRYVGWLVSPPHRSTDAFVVHTHSLTHTYTCHQHRHPTHVHLALHTHQSARVSR